MRLRLPWWRREEPEDPDDPVTIWLKDRFPEPLPWWIGHYEHPKFNRQAEREFRAWLREKLERGEIT